MKSEELIALLDERGLDENAKVQLLQEALDQLNSQMQGATDEAAEQKKAAELLGVDL